MTEFDDVRDGIVLSLQAKGWKNIKHSVRFPSSSGMIDIVAYSGGIRKKTLMISIGSNPFDAGIAGLLLSGITEKGDKVIFLQEGSPIEVQASPGIRVVARPEDLPEA